MLLDGKKLLITGVLTDDSIAFAVAKVAQEQGAEILLTNVGKGVRLTEKVARKLPVAARRHADGREQPGRRQRPFATTSRADGAASTAPSTRSPSRHRMRWAGTS